MKEHDILKIDKNTRDGFLNLILALQNAMAVMTHDMMAHYCRTGLCFRF